MAHSLKLNLPSLANTRDLSGISGAGGKHIRKDSLFRSGELTKASDADMQSLYNDHDLRVIIDLRNRTEGIQKPDRVPKRVTYILNPILTEAHMGMTHEEETDAETADYIFVRRILANQNPAEFMKGLYLNFINDRYCLAQYRKMIDIIAKPGTGGILYHCSVGKDRAGIATFFILKLLGAADQDIIEDFMMTNEFIEDKVTANLRRMALRIDDPRLEQTYRALFQVKKDYIETFMRHIKELYGSYDSFFRTGLGVSEEEQAALQAKYLY